MLRRISARYSRGIGAAVVAVAALVLAANAGPARASEPSHHAHHAHYTPGASSDSESVSSGPGIMSFRL
ncbi:hypothetical protein OG762_21330 [Streptomyces sp. NBC_01136]|uniref:hypothetical protein n=1 Tax=unclassified Streptomyces TaxID=2593676 RepID=UPI0032568BD8|nr:hypothetical protein OG762_21330 [Streptomyces sp. NBC_01136]